MVKSWVPPKDGMVAFGSMKASVQYVIERVLEDTGEQLYTAADLQRARIEAATAQREADAKVRCLDCQNGIPLEQWRPIENWPLEWTHRYIAGAMNGKDDLMSKCAGHAIRTAPLADGMQGELEKLLEETREQVFRLCAIHVEEGELERNPRFFHGLAEQMRREK